MATPKTSTFTSYSLSDQELLEGAILSNLQEFVIQNDLAAMAEQILNLTYNPQNPMDFVQQDAHLKGQMVVLRSLLTRSDDAKASLRKMAETHNPFDSSNF